MGTQEKVTGIVLSAMPIGDYDKRLVILTKEYGKITAFARGAKRPTSSLLAGSQPFAFGDFQVYAGKSSYTVVSCHIKTYFEQLRKDLTAVFYASYFCEVMEYLTRENLDAADYLNLLYVSLRALEKKQMEYPLIRSAFEIRTMQVNGEAMEVFSCIRCGRQENLQETDLFFGHFSVQNGGLLCGECAEKGVRAKQTKEEPVMLSLTPGAVYTVQYIQTVPLSRLYSFRVSEEVSRELARLCSAYLKRYLNVRFHSLECLELL